jgi:hypothetical protein
MEETDSSLRKILLVEKNKNKYLFVAYIYVPHILLLSACIAHLILPKGTL